VLVAVSGGADSTALLVALCSIAHEQRWVVHAAHLDHRLRGHESDADAAFVAELCARLGVPLRVARWDTTARMRTRGLTGENGLRLLRREFLSRAARAVRADFVATAHTADDQLETLLLRLLRGTGLRGLGGMRPRTGRWIRPLLHATRAEIVADLRAAGQSWREDRSNDSRTIARNRVRHDVIPALVEAAGPLGPGDAGSDRRARLARRVASLALELQQVESALRQWTSRLRRDASGAAEPSAAPRGGRKDAREFRIDIGRYRRYPVAARRELLRALWRRAAPAGVGLEASHLSQIDRLGSGARGPVALPAGFSAVHDSGSIRIRQDRIQGGSGDARRTARGEPPSPLRVPGCAERRGLKVSSRWTSPRQAQGGISEIETSREYFAADGIRGLLEVRQARADETFIPFGRSRPIRIREFLKKLPARSQASPTVLADDSGILWVIGVRRSSRAPVQPSTRKVLCVHAERHD
jgi:tRNA(Ile)-lysidine synthase